MATLVSGNDSISLGAATTASITGDTGTDTVVGSSDADTLTLASVESLDAGDGNDVVSMTDGSLVNGDLGLWQ